MNDSNLREKENLSGIINTEKKLMNAECVNITKEKKWKRNCPECNKEIFHTKRWVRNEFHKLNKKCKSCGAYNKGKVLDSSVREKIGNANRGRHPSLESRKRMSISQSKRKHSENVKQKMRGSGNGMYGVHRYDAFNPFYNKKHSSKSKYKMRLAAINRMKNNGILTYRNFNKTACEYLNRLNEQMGWNLQHAVNGGEVELYGYFVDGYDKERNIVVEYDELRHYKRGILREKDIIRMNEIKNYLKCRFLRYNEYIKELKEY